MKNELLVPPIAESDPNAIEVVRVWMAKGGQHVGLNPLVWKDPQAWALCLQTWPATLLMLTNKNWLDRQATMRKITDLLLAELKNPTDTARGQIHNTRRAHRGS